MKKYIVIILSISCILLLVGCSKAGNSETIAFHDKTFNKADLSQETIEWLEWYNDLPEDEQLAISYIPSEVYKLSGYSEAETIDAESELIAEEDATDEIIMHNGKEYKKSEFFGKMDSGKRLERNSICNTGRNWLDFGSLDDSKGRYV